ncbi:VOC family protein [Caulobacter sp. NIBR2454]|uniref:VOC family protein n=1 Tax=Caulobacter sp. NIBR2454 TaxID=3015996 RepID=UPI0022B71B3E|nr:VOC family protein [Caulobacter sp. NIBR2454]
MAENQGPTAGLTPYLISADAAAQLAFYVRAFGAVEQLRHLAEDGKRFMHLHLLINDAPMMMCDAFPEYGHPAQAPAGFTLHLQVDDADAWWKRATEAGATVAMPLEDQFWGDRYGQVIDPFGVRWSIGSSRKA